MEGHASLSARHMCLTPGPSLATLPSEMRVRTAAGGPSRPHRRAVAPVAPARAAKPPRSRSAEGVATRGFGRRREGEVHGPSAGPRNLTGTRAGRGPRHGYAPRCATRGGRLRGRTARVWAAVGPCQRCQRVVAVPNGRHGRVAVTLALVGRLEWIQGSRSPSYDHPDGAASWLVSNRVA